MMLWFGLHVKRVKESEDKLKSAYDCDKSEKIEKRDF